MPYLDPTTIGLSRKTKMEMERFRYNISWDNFLNEYIKYLKQSNAPIHPIINKPRKFKPRNLLRDGNKKSELKQNRFIEID